jgi:hypothetical protein
MSVDLRNPLVFWPTAFGALLIWIYISKWYEAWKERRSLRQIEENKRGCVWSDEKKAFVLAPEKKATDASDDEG